MKLTAAQKAARTRKRRAAARKAAATKRKKSAGQKAAKTIRRKAAARKAAATRRDQLNRRKRIMPSPVSLPNKVVLRRFEGGTAYTAEQDGKFYVIEDESSMAGILSEEDLAGMELERVKEFGTEADRRAYLSQRRWL